MASLFTHALVGGAAAGLAPPGSGRLRLAAVLAALAVLPDADVLAFSLGIPYEHPLGHRGLSHSLSFALACGLVTPWLAGVARVGRRWWGFAALGALATASHGVLDAATDGGLGVGFGIPWSDERWFFAWRPLAVSPLSFDAFFSRYGAHVLASEVRWVWLPLGVAAAGLALGRRRARTAR